jgi:aspartyl-tRNA(Asn)/glutamyl-tRNA(Gln) amidotransferase subunit A
LTRKKEAFQIRRLLMSREDICWMSAADLAKSIRRKKLSPVEVVEDILERIEVINPKINAYVTVIANSALAEAKKAEKAVMKGGELGPLHGVPFSVKDLVFTKGVRTTFGCKLLEDFVPEEDAVHVARLKTAGAIMLGKTNTSEFGFKPLTDNLIFGITRNPWKLEKSPGGSSGGAAAAVASGLGPLAVGVDGGGSIRIPSSCCGVFGIKPQLGRVPRYPAYQGGELITHEGPITRTVRDAALMLDVMAGYHWGDFYSLPAPAVSFTKSLKGGVKGLKIAWSPDLGYATVDPQVKAICEKAAREFSSLGGNVDEAHPAFDNPESHIGTFFGSDALVALSVLGPIDQIIDKLSPLSATMLFLATELKATDYVKAVFAKHELSVKSGRFFQSYDLLLTPTLASPPLPVDFEDPIGYLKWLPFTPVFNFTGQPAASVPAGWTKEGLPVGLQIVGRPYDEATVFRAAAAFEEAHPWAQRKPPLK